MKGLSYPRVALVLVLLSSAAVSFAASVDPALLKAKQEAESKGYLFITNREEIVAKAEQEGKLHVLTGMEPPTLKASAAAFKKRYPFIDLHIQETTGTEGDERQILEIKSGARDWDIHRLAVDRYSDYLPYLLKIDILGMVQRGVLQSLLRCSILGIATRWPFTTVLSSRHTTRTSFRRIRFPRRGKTF